MKSGLYLLFALFSITLLSACNNRNLDMADTRPTEFQRQNAAEQRAYSYREEEDTPDVPYAGTTRMTQAEAPMENIGAYN